MGEWVGGGVGVGVGGKGGGSVGRASDSRFYDISDPSSNPVRSTINMYE